MEASFNSSVSRTTVEKSTPAAVSRSFRRGDWEARMMGGSMEGNK